MLRAKPRFKFCVDEGFLKKKMSEVASDIFRLSNERGGGYIATNYGQALFDFFFDNRKLLEYATEKERRGALDALKEKGVEDPNEIPSEDLFGDDVIPYRIAQEHPEGVNEGVVCLYVFVERDVEIEAGDIDKDIKSLSAKLRRLKKIKEISDQLNIDWVEGSTVDEEGDIIKGYTGCLESYPIGFNGDETVEELMIRIDKLITPLKEHLTSWSHKEEWDWIDQEIES